MEGDLIAYVERHRGRPFNWATDNCMGFLSGALEAQGLPGLPRDWCEGYATPREALRAYKAALRTYGHETLRDAIDARFDRVLTLHPRDGMICARRSDDVTGHAFGVALNAGCVFLTADGARWFDVEAGDLFWRAV